MRNRLQHTHILTALLVLVIIVSSAILGGAWYLIDYALKPGDRSRNEQLAWAEMDSLYPGMAAWRDSLQAVHALRDTFIIAKDGGACACVVCEGSASNGSHGFARAWLHRLQHTHDAIRANV